MCFSPKDEKNKSFAWQGGTYFQVQRKYVRVDAAGLIDYNTFKGEYLNDELGKITIKNKRNKLYLQAKHIGKAELIPVSARIFSVGSSAVKVRFNDREMTVGDSRIYNFKFSKINRKLR